MALVDLSKRLTDAIRGLGKSAEPEDEAVDKCMNSIVRALMESDVSFKYVASLRNAVKTALQLDHSNNKQRIIQKTIFDELVKLLSPSKTPFKLKKGKSSVVVFVGLQGAGKTTTCAKYAHYHQKKGWKVALVCADTFRAGAFDQLKQNALKTRIPFYGSYSETDPVKVAAEGVELFRRERYDLIIVDTSGRHRQESALFEEMRQVHSAVKADEAVFVMDSHIGQACYDQALSFSQTIDVGSVIVTKLDGHAKGGGALSAVAATGAPITFIGTGEHLDQLDKFDAKGFVGRLMGMGDISGLVEAVKGAVDIEAQKEMMGRLKEGRFTLRDFYSQLQTAMKMGPMGKVMSMIPGMSAAGLPAGLEEAGGARLKRFVVIMDSLKSEELDSGKVVVDPVRLVKIAKGAGAQIPEVLALFEEHKKVQKMVEKLGKTGLMGKGGDLNALTRNPGQVMKMLQQAVDPATLAQMGGAQNLMGLMKDMESNPEMAAMMKQMQAGNKKRR